MRCTLISPKLVQHSRKCSNNLKLFRCNYSTNVTLIIIRKIRNEPKWGHQQKSGHSPYDDIDSNSVFFARNHKNFIGRELFKLLYYNKKKYIKHQTYVINNPQKGALLIRNACNQFLARFCVFVQLTLQQLLNGNCKSHLYKFLDNSFSKQIKAECNAGMHKRDNC